MKKNTCLAVVIALLLLAMAAPASAGSSAEAALIMDYATGQILYAENIDAPLPPASITKLITMHLVFEAISQGKISLTDQVRASANAAALPDGSATIFLGAGEILTVEELLDAVAIISANDAGVALAEYIAGSEAAFIELMNEKARELGLTNTTFLNVHGLHAPGHVMSARDIALLSRATLAKYPEITAYSSRVFMRMERDKRFVRQGYFDLHSTYASLIGWRNIDGLKTGWTPEAGRCITVTAAENGRRYIVVVMGAKTIEQRDKKVKELLAQAFDLYEAAIPLQAGEVVGTVSIEGAKSKQAEIGPARDVVLVMARNGNLEDFEERMDITPGLRAPLNTGDVVGVLSYSKAGETVASVDLVLKEDVEKAGFLTLTFRFLGKVFLGFGAWLLGLFK